MPVVPRPTFAYQPNEGDRPRGSDISRYREAPARFFARGVLPRLASLLMSELLVVQCLIWMISWL
ncbi:MAG: hypothetical protein ACRDYX_11535 [Egibacteraceae bacterium]